MSKTATVTVMSSMARPRPELPDPAAIRALIDDDGRLTVRVTPGARDEGVALAEGRIRIKVRTKPEGGKANLAVIQLLAAALDIPASRLQMLRGATGRDKQFRIDL